MGDDEYVHGDEPLEDYCELEYFEQIMNQGFADVMCPGCSEEYRIEPDAEFDCNECGSLVQSPLIKEGLI